MPLFFGKRDVSMMRKVNREVINDISDIQVDIYKVNAEFTNSNLYGESDAKVYDLPLRIHALVNREGRAWVGERNQTFTQGAEFYFLRDDLIEAQYVVEVGDIIDYNGEYYEIDGTQENQYGSGKNTDYAYSGIDHGWNVSIIATAHVVQRNIVTIENVRPGMTRDDSDLPGNL